MEPFSEIEGSATEMRAMARGLYSVALVDGLHERETTLISALFGHRPAAWAPDGGAPVAVPLPMPALLARLGPLEPSNLATLLPSPARRQTFLTAAYLVAWADGKVSFAERALMDSFAAALGVPSEVLTRLEAEVKDGLLPAGSVETEGAKLAPSVTSG